MTFARRAGAMCALVVTLGACGGATKVQVPRVAEAERMRASLEGRDPSALAPQAFAMAGEELRRARAAEERRDHVGAELYADRALAGYSRAIALARLARANEEDASANEALARATEQATRYGGERRAIEREADELDKQLKIAREAQLPTPSGPADGERERARLTASRALTTQARLLCSAARLVSAEAPGLGEAESAVAALEKQLAAAAKTAAPIDPAGRARAACLASLTKARRALGAKEGEADALLTELSQSLSSRTAKPTTLELVPSRDERGVLVTIRGAFQGAALSKEAEAALRDLGRVAGAHPTFAVQIVVHEAGDGAREAARSRGEAVAGTMTAAGAPAGRVRVEQAGSTAPVIDPADAKRRERNARVEVVFVSPAS